MKVKSKRDTLTAQREKAVLSMIEAELIRYPQTKKDVTTLCSEMIEPTGAEVKVITTGRLLYLSRVVQSIEKILAETKPEKRRVIDMLFWGKPKERDTIEQQAGYSIVTRKRFKAAILREVAAELGYI